MPRKLEIDDLGKFVMASNPQLSPDGESLVYVATRVEGDAYVSTLYLVDPKDGSHRRFWENARNPVWNPNGSQLLFVSTRGMKDGEKGAGIWVTTLCSEPRLVCKAPGGAEQPLWSGDGSKIFFLSYVGEEPKDVRVIDGIPFWFDAVGWTHYRRKHLHVVDVASSVVRQVTEGEGDIVCHAPSNSGEKVAYAISQTELQPRETDIYVFDLKKGNCTRILDKYTVASLAWSRDDELIAFTGNDLSRGYPTHTTVWVIPPMGGEPTDLTGKLDRGSGRAVYNGFRSPFAGPPNPVWDDGRIYFPVSDGADTTCTGSTRRMAKLSPS
jgi:dipeptidyl aminopeptidase/acylaminoacyl peptidase